jgi:uncharacterized protein (TIRG00374 family)
LNRPEWWRWIVGLALLLVLVTAIGPRALLATLRGAAPAWILPIVGLSIAWLLLGALNVWLLLRVLSPVSHRIFVRAYVTSWAVSLLLPGQLGDATQVLLLRQHGVPVASSGAAYLLDKAISLIWLSAVAACGLALYTRFSPGLWLLVLLALVSAAAGAAVLASRMRLEPGTRLGRLKAVFMSSIEQLVAFRGRPGSLLRNLALTIGKWGLTVLLYLSAFLAFGARPDLAAVATIPIVSSLVGYLPITVAGAGTMELTGVLLFREVGVQAATVLSVYLLLRSVLLLVALALVLTSKAQGGAQETA